MIFENVWEPWYKSLNTELEFVWFAISFHSSQVTDDVELLLPVSSQHSAWLWLFPHNQIANLAHRL